MALGWICVSLAEIPRCLSSKVAVLVETLFDDGKGLCHCTLISTSNTFYQVGHSPIVFLCGQIDFFKNWGLNGGAHLKEKVADSNFKTSEKPFPYIIYK